MFDTVVKKYPFDLMQDDDDKTFSFVILLLLAATIMNRMIRKFFY